MHAHIRRLAAVALVVGLAPPAVAQLNDPGQVGQIRDRNWEARCQMVSRIFHRLGEQRAGEADRDAAVFRVSQWAAQAGDVGSHQKVDYRLAVEAAADFVYTHAELLPVTLAHFGYRSCAFEKRFAAEPLRIEASQMLLLDAARACQKDHPGEKHNRPLHDCVKQQSLAIGKRVEKAKITVAP